MTISITVDGAYLVGPTENLTYTGSAADGLYSHDLYVLGPSGEVTIEGQVLVQDSTDNVDLYGAYSSASTGAPALAIAQGGSLTVSATGTGSGAYGMYAGYAPGSFSNAGTFTVSGAGSATGVQFADGGTISNTGSMTVTAGLGNAQGWYVNGAATISNTGSFSATGPGAQAIVVVNYDGGAITNSGTIAATAANAADEAHAIWIGSTSNGVESIVNTGTITAVNTQGGQATAIQAFAPTTYFLNFDLTNGSTGVIEGDIVLGNGLGSHILNQGTINGAVTLGITGNDVYDGRGGSLSGGLTLGGGADTVYLGNDGETVHGGSGTAIVYGGTDNDAIAGGPGADFITGGGGNDTLTGGGGADTFAFRVPTGSVTITDFSSDPGAAIDLTAVGNWNLAAVLARAVQSGANTVITLNGLTITLDNVTATTLQASDFVFGAIKVLPTDDFAIDPSVTIGLTAGPLVQFTGNAGGTLINKGSMTLSDPTSGGTGVATPSAVTPDPTALFENDGSFNVTVTEGVGVQLATLHNSGTFDVTATQNLADGATGDVVNSGHMTIVGGTAAVGADDQNTQNGTFQNLSGGVVSVSATQSAYGAQLHAGSDFENDGQITVSAATAYGVAYQAYGPSNTLLNSGTITATGAASTGIAVSAQDGVASVSLTNSGTIAAQTAIQYSGTAANITNTGIVNGAVQLADYNNTILNNGTIDGAVDLGNGTNSLDSGGFINGSVYLGTGSDTVYLSKGYPTVFLAAGTHVVSSLGAIVTASYANAASGVDVNLNSHGLAQHTGVGIDTLSGVSALIGSPYNDTLEGHALTGNSSTLTGGGGADTFVYGLQDGNVAITDFSGAEGDKIDLSAFWSMANFSDLLANAHQDGSDTVIAPPPQSIWLETLTLKGVSLASLTASDFYFYPTTVTGTAANNYAVSFQGVSQQYRVAAQGAKVMGGPDNVSDALANIQRIQFVDGYLATSPTDTAGQVYRVYEATLNRAPDPEGLANWVHALAGGSSLQTVVDGFVGSQEFQADYGALSNTDFVTLLYHNVLHRDPDTDGLNNWVNALNTGQDTRAQVVLGFSESQEDITDSTAAVQQGLWIQDAAAAQAARLYDTVFGRLPDAGGLINWTHSLESGTSLQTAAADFVASQEFQTKYGALGDSAFLTLLYQNVLHRAPDADGMNNWLNTLASGTSRAQVVLDFSESQEHVADTAPHIDYGVWVAS